MATWQLALGGDAIQYRARIGRLHRKHPGVYAVGRSELTVKGHWMAAALAYGPDAVISHRTAAALWGIGTSSPRAFENERLRDIKLMKAGYRVMRVTAKRLNNEPAAVLADIKALARL